MKELHTTLAELYWRGLTLPETDPWPDNSDNDDLEEELAAVEHRAADLGKPDFLERIKDDPAHQAHMADYRRARDLLDSKFEGRDFHRLVFDPYSPDDSQRDAVTASLSDHLADIYAGIRDLFRRESTESQIEWIWQARLQLTELWGLTDVLPAVTALGWLVYQYWDDYDEKWTEVWTPPPRKSNNQGEQS
jgi:hypothetical protein